MESYSGRAGLGLGDLLVQALHLQMAKSCPRENVQGHTVAAN